jgi:hypothetical protein
MRRTATLLTTLASIYVASSAEDFAFRTGDQVREPRPQMEYRNTALKKEALVALVRR